jgi:hypothetical protein
VYATDEYSHLNEKAEEIIPTWSPVKFFGGYQNAK